MTLTDEEWQRDFNSGQEYEKNIQSLNTHVKGSFESDEHFEAREETFEEGRRSIQNDPNQ